MIPTPPSLDPNTTALRLFTLYLGLPLVGFAILAVRRSVRLRDPLPVLLLVGGLAASPLETVLCHNGLCTYPTRGQWTAFTAYGVHVPVSTVFAYGWWLGGFTAVLIRMMKGSAPAGRYWQLFWGLTVATLFVEYPSLWWMQGHRYYGKQPFWLAGLPLWWSFVNPLSAFVVAALIVKLLPLLPGWRRLAVIVLVPMGDALLHAGVGFPTWIALNSGRGYAVTYPAGTLTILLSLFVMRLIVESVAPPGRVSTTRSGAPRPTGLTI